MLRDARATNNQERKQLILGLKHAEETRRCFALVHNILHPKTPGGLTHLLIPIGPDKLEWQQVMEVDQMEDHLLEHSRQHFSQAHGTPFTQPPLSELLGFSGITPFGDLIYQGHPLPPDIKLAPATELLLKHQRRLLPLTESTSHPHEFEPLMNGIQKWPECTTTSPSGRHLGIYKSLLKDKPPKDPPKDLPPQTYGQDVMHYIYRLLQLALHHTHVYQRWCTVWNMYLEKKPGNPRIDLLRTLHLFEADYNLLLKWHSSKGFMTKAEHNNTLQDNQGGGRPGRSAIDLACKKMVIFDYVYLT